MLLFFYMEILKSKSISGPLTYTVIELRIRHSDWALRAPAAADRRCWSALPTAPALLSGRHTACRELLLGPVLCCDCADKQQIHEEETSSKTIMHIRANDRVHNALETPWVACACLLAWHGLQTSDAAVAGQRSVQGCLTGTSPICGR